MGLISFLLVLFCILTSAKPNTHPTTTTTASSSHTDPHPTTTTTAAANPHSDHHPTTTTASSSHTDPHPTTTTTAAANPHSDHHPNLDPTASNHPNSNDEDDASTFNPEDVEFVSNSPASSTDPNPGQEPNADGYDADLEDAEPDGVSNSPATASSLGSDGSSSSSADVSTTSDHHHAVSLPLPEDVRTSSNTLSPGSDGSSSPSSDVATTADRHQVVPSPSPESVPTTSGLGDRIRCDYCRDDIKASQDIRLVAECGHRIHQKCLYFQYGENAGTLCPCFGCRAVADFGTLRNEDESEEQRLDTEDGTSAGGQVSSEGMIAVTYNRSDRSEDGLAQPLVLIEIDSGLCNWSNSRSFKKLVNQLEHLWVKLQRMQECRNVLYLRLLPLVTLFRKEKAAVGKLKVEEGVASNDVFGATIEITVQWEQSMRPIPNMLVKCEDYLVLSDASDSNASLPDSANQVDVAALVKYYLASLPEPLTAFVLL
ncbi:Cdk-activating kinase assembly factor [Trema orientale]|uniref:Cdk-activating kinase assembly factor n=1 Tax=Trema orientale TaxID=63057 RepID=A0A2P5F3W8_TREOI|nr:Cdk-activating kinase assembly factor [Trema orientale]